MSETTPGELVKELDRLREGARHEDSHSGAMIFESKARILVENEFGLILKSLRFAADMEVLSKHDPKFWIEHGICTCEFSLVPGDPYSRRTAEGTDIYSAARAAVEALKGKQ